MSFWRHGEIYREARWSFADAGRRAQSADAPTHPLDEFPIGYSSAGCAPAEPASASPTGSKLTMTGTPQPSLFQRMGKPCLASCLTSGVHSAQACKSEDLAELGTLQTAVSVPVLLVLGLLLTPADLKAASFLDPGRTADHLH